MSQIKFKSLSYLQNKTKHILSDTATDMAGNEESDIVGKYKMNKEQQMDEMLQAMGFTYTSRRAIMTSTKYFKIEKNGEYWHSIFSHCILCHTW